MWSIGFLGIGFKVAMKEWGMSRRKSSRREEESECVGGKGGREGGRSMEGKRREREREMMGVIRIKTVGFGQSRVRTAVSVPTPHPPPVPSSSPNQPLWHMQGASVTHKQTAHGCEGEHPNKYPYTWFYKVCTICGSSQSVVDYWILTGGLLIWLDTCMTKWDYGKVASSVPTHKFRSMPPTATESCPAVAAWQSVNIYHSAHLGAAVQEKYAILFFFTWHTISVHLFFLLTIIW